LGYAQPKEFFKCTTEQVLIPQSQALALMGDSGPRQLAELPFISVSIVIRPSTSASASFSFSTNKWAQLATTTEEHLPCTLIESSRQRGEVTMRERPFAEM
jgi:hypothetical protein